MARTIQDLAESAQIAWHPDADAYTTSRFNPWIDRFEAREFERPARDSDAVSDWGGDVAIHWWEQDDGILGIQSYDEAAWMVPFEALDGMPEAIGATCTFCDRKVPSVWACETCDAEACDACHESERWSPEPHQCAACEAEQLAIGD